MSAEGLRDKELIRSYVMATGELQRGLCMPAVESGDFTHRLVI